MNCVTQIPASKFSTFGLSAAGLTRSPILQRLATESGKGIDVVLTEIELPPTLEIIGRAAFLRNTAVTGNLTIPRNVTTIGNLAFAQLGSTHVTGRSPDNIASSRAPALTFETGSKLRTIGVEAFDGSGSRRVLVLPDGLAAIGSEAFRRFIMPSGDLVIPGNVSSIGGKAFSVFAGINDGVTIRSEKLAKVGTNSPLGNNLFGSTGSDTEPRESTITTIKLPASVYTSYSSAERTAIFGSEVTAYQDLTGSAHP